MISKKLYHEKMKVDTTEQGFTQEMLDLLKTR